MAEDYITIKKSYIFHTFPIDEAICDELVTGIYKKALNFMNKAMALKNSGIFTYYVGNSNFTTGERVTQAKLKIQSDNLTEKISASDLSAKTDP